MGRNKDELIKLAEKITGQECKDVLTKKDALKKIACYYLGEEKEFASIADCLESIVEHGATGGGSVKLYAYVSSNVDIPHPIYLYTSTVPDRDFTGQTTCFQVDRTKLNLKKSDFNSLYSDNPRKTNNISFRIAGSTFTRNKSYDIEF